MEYQGENKVVIVGESGVGKTCILDQYINKNFIKGKPPTLAAQFCRKNFNFPDGKSITLDIWDTAGQEKYRSLNRIYYKNAKAAIIVYDITDTKSFNEAKNYWCDQIIQNCDNDVVIAIAANKCDLYEERKILDEDGEELAKSIGAFFSSTSAKNDSGINNLFEIICQKLLNPDFDFYANKLKTNAKKENHENKKDIKNGETENKKDNSKSSIKLDRKVKKKKKKCFKIF